MPSLREKVTTYFRQLSFIAEPREGGGGHKSTKKTDDGNFIIKYLEGRMDSVFIPGPDIKSAKIPNDLPELLLSFYPTGPNTITAACTGPDEGLCGIKRSKLHLSAGSDIDFIDTIQDQDQYEIRKSISNSRQKFSNFNISQTTQQITLTTNITTTCTSSTKALSTRYGSDQNANKTSTINCSNTRSRKNSRSSGNESINNSIEKSSKTNINECNTITAINNKLNNIDKIIDDNQQQHKQTSTTDFSESSKDCKNVLVGLVKTNYKDKIDGNIPNEKKKLSSSTSIKQIENIIEESLTEVVSNNHHHSLKHQDVLLDDEPIAGVKNWKMESDHAYGISVSLYEYNMISKESMGNPIADCYGLVVRGNCAAMALADGVNWGDGARLAARSAVHGSLDYLDTAIFGVAQECKATTTRDVFVSLLRSFWEAHDCILEVGGALSTLTVAVILPLGGQNTGKYVVCGCNVGDSLGYIYSKKHGVREFTQGSHDITCMRDMRDALGALGPADGNKPELGNLTLSMTILDSGDIVFLTSDGISDNFDPVVGKFAEPWTPNSRAHNPHLIPKRQNKSTSAMYTRSSKENKPSTETHTKPKLQSKIYSNNTSTNNAALPIRPPRNRKMQQQQDNNIITGTSSSQQASIINSTSNRPKYMRSHTVIEPRGTNIRNQGIVNRIPRSAAGLPLVTGPQRHALTLLRLEDLLSYGINGSLKPCQSAKKLCHLLIDFVKMITSARRKTLEQRELFYKLITDHDGVKREIELNRIQHKSTRKRIVDSSAFASLPGKLDHATIVAFTVGSGLQMTEFQETNF